MFINLDGDGRWRQCLHLPIPPTRLIIIINYAAYIREIAVGRATLNAHLPTTFDHTLYHSFLDWVFFGKEGAITENDPIEQEKRLKYLDLVAGAIILHNTVDMSLAIQTLMSRGEVIPMRHLAALSPYITRHIKRYGDYVVNLQNIPQPLEAAINLPPEIFES
ncbi:Tn3 family transposase [Tolypothrix bouteillei VB521301_2]|uniref:Tn3 family transposase n=1 Tax=Tolypothrix bouteillei TaxID=1246981 RepID=UPI0038B4D170